MKRILITGGAGFVGVNAARRFASDGWKVVVVDDLSRKGSSVNLDWLRSEVDVDFRRIDIRDAEPLARSVRKLRPDVVLHLAAQVAVTTSVVDPRTDFEINALGTFNVLEAVRRESPESIVLNASTNKVYGKLENLEVEERGGRWEFRDCRDGVGEDQPLDFHSPYGCSKGVGDQYVIDYSRIYGLRTLTFRQSCIYGPRQMGVEDQGWVAWFTIASVLGKDVSIYGDGKQIRDLLWVDDLVELYQAGISAAERGVGGAFNIGGGPDNTMSLLELLAHLERLNGRTLAHRFDAWRPGDQKVFVCDVSKAAEDLGWKPRTSVAEGVERLHGWVAANRDLFVGLFAG
ncbi:MAG: SDR family NAD(P)-dependent oxidoreductase [Thermoanaerobaculia bacterium]